VRWLLTTSSTGRQRFVGVLAGGSSAQAGKERWWISRYVEFGWDAAFFGCKVGRDPLLDIVGWDVKRYPEQTKYRSSWV